MIQRITSKIVFRVMDEIPDICIDKLATIITGILSEYTISNKETSVVPVDNTNSLLFKKFIVSKTVEGMSRNSINQYSAAIELLLKTVNKNVSEITTDDIRIVLAQKQLSGDWGAVTCNNNRRMWSSFFQWLTDEEYVQKNPCARIKMIKSPGIIKKPFSPLELEKLRSACANLRDTAILETLFSTGCRVSELSMIKLSDIDFVKDEIMVTGKGNKQRIVYMNPKCVHAINNYLKSRTDDREWLFVALSNPFDRLEKGGIEIRVRELGLNCGVSQVHPHRFRRTAATVALSRGMPLEQVSLMLGHAKIETTTIYAQTNQRDLKISHEKYLT